MALKLNKIADAVVLEELEDTRKRLDKKLAAPLVSEDPSVLEKHYHAVFSYSYDLGMMLYQQERDPQEIRTHLGRAGEFLVRELSMKQKPKENEYRSPWDFEKAVELVVCFCNVNERGAAARVEQWQYYSPSNPELEPLLQYLEALKRFLTGGSLDRVAWTKVESHCQSDIATKEDRVFLLPKVRGLRALADRDEKNWQAGISELVKAHEVEAKRGEYKLSYDGFISLQALMLAQLGRENGMKCGVSSHYLPLKLLEL